MKGKERKEEGAGKWRGRVFLMEEEYTSSSHGCGGRFLLYNSPYQPYNYSNRKNNIEFILFLATFG